jgi:hypothetical protein
VGVLMGASVDLPAMIVVEMAAACLATERRFIEECGV